MGHWLKFLVGRSCRPVGLDISEVMLARAHETVPSLPLVRARAEGLPFGNQCFDRVFCVNALHHFTSSARFLKEARRVIRAGGAVMTVGLDPHTGFDRWYIYEYFPETLELDKGRYPATGIIRSQMVRAGFTRCETLEVQRIRMTVPATAARTQGLLNRSYTSQLTILTDEEYAHGVQRIGDGIDRAARSGTEPLLEADLRLYATMGWTE